MADQSAKINPQRKNLTDKDNKFLTFALAGEEYGIAILKVREIITLVPITIGTTHSRIC